MKKYISRREFSRRLELYVDSTRTCFEASLRSFEDALIKVNKRMDQISCNVDELKRQLDCDSAGLRFIPPLEMRTNHNKELEKLREISLNKIRIPRQQCTGEKIELVENSRIKKVNREIGCDNLLSPDEWKIAARKQIAALHIQNEDKLNFSHCEHAEFSESESDVISDSERVSDCDSDSDSCFSLDKESSHHKMQESKFDKLDKVTSQVKICSQHRHEDALEESDIITFNIKKEELSDTDENFNNLNENKKQWVPDKNNNLDDDKKQSENDQNTNLDNTKSGNSLSLSGLMAPSSSSSSHKQSSSSQSYIDVTGYQSSSSQKSSQSSQSSRIPKSGRRAHKNMGGSQGDSKYPGPSIDWVPDPNEPTYCICNQVSYGEMVGCDNNSCPIEWFHYGCVGLTDAPKGKWYCRDCSVQIKKKRMR